MLCGVRMLRKQLDQPVDTAAISTRRTAPEGFAFPAGKPLGQGGMGVGSVPMSAFSENGTLLVITKIFFMLCN